MPKVVQYEYVHCSIINRSRNVTYHQGARLNIWVYLYNRMLHNYSKKMRSICV